MSIVRKPASTPIQSPRFGVVQGNRGSAMPAPAAMEVPKLRLAVQPDLRASLPVPAPRRHNGLHLVTDAVKAAGRTSAKASADTFGQARRIVAQVEWEIQQQAARERRMRMAGWNGSAMRPAVINFQHSGQSMSTAPWMQTVDRLCRFFGF